ncbi:unnamed protein product [Brachionus calyciflorus]|uniref:FLYWCH-type domain-containing protein n=1 Tax=Brachionus calyciflorus TaxID=104777 RepID=A0A814FAF0_9BILA|nr:unnamed protein product [Brachionus calyciflorus]
MSKNFGDELDFILVNVEHVYSSDDESKDDFILKGKRRAIKLKAHDSEGKQIWRCRLNKKKEINCKVLAYTKVDLVLAVNSEHNHEQAKKGEIVMINAKNIKTRAKNDTHSIKKIFVDEIPKAIKDNRLTIDEATEYAPKYKKNRENSLLRLANFVSTKNHLISSEINFNDAY